MDAFNEGAIDGALIGTRDEDMDFSTINDLYRHFKAIVASSDDAIISKNVQGIVTSWNAGAQRLFGYSAQEMIGHTLLKLFPVDKVNEEQFILEKIIAGEKVDHFETIRLHKDGTPLNISVTISPIFDQTGAVIGASKIARDITDKKVAEARLELTSRVFTNTNEAIVITDAFGIIIEVNEAFCNISGYTREDVIGRPPTMFSSSRQGPEILAVMLDSLDQHGHYQGELWSRRKGGESYAGYLKVSVVRDAANRIQNYVALFADITSLRIKQEELEHLAHFDALTDLPNRILLSDRLHQAMASSQRSKKSLAVLYLDLDGFKEINDQYGHNVGDEMLVAVSHNMKAVLRNVDTLARIGGDEYAVVLADVQSPHQCGCMVERILRACAEPVALHGNVLQITASIGVTIYPEDAVDADQLLRHADRAMYEAKQAGKNRYHIFDSMLDAEVKTRGLQHERIRHALATNEFFLNYQPKVNMRTGAVVGFEALIRWNHPKLGLLSPDAFLPMIEFHPLSEELDEWVVNAALLQMDAWRKAGLKISVSVNIGARQLQKKDFPQRLAAALDKYPDVDPHTLDIEILETCALQDIQAVAEAIRQCQQSGVHFSVDDFGTGYSSLTYLRHLPAETLKIDRSFVGNMLEDCENRAIVQAVIGLATAFRRDVIAEGVETVEIGEKLLELGCDLGQGYGISKPLLAADVPSWIANWQSYPSWK